MKVLSIALCALILGVGGPLAAQDATAQIRAQAKQLEGHLTKQEFADMLAQADGIEKGANEGSFNAGPAPSERSVTSRLMQEQGRVEWLSKYSVCTGFQDNDYRTSP